MYEEEVLQVELSCARLLGLCRKRAAAKRAAKEALEFSLKATADAQRLHLLKQQKQSSAWALDEERLAAQEELREKQAAAKAALSSGYTPQEATAFFNKTFGMVYASALAKSERESSLRRSQSKRASCVLRFFSVEELLKENSTAAPFLSVSTEAFLAAGDSEGAEAELRKEALRLASRLEAAEHTCKVRSHDLFKAFLALSTQPPTTRSCGLGKRRISLTLIVRLHACEGQTTFNVQPESHLARVIETMKDSFLAEARLQLAAAAADGAQVHLQRVKAVRPSCSREKSVLLLCVSLPVSPPPKCRCVFATGACDLQLALKQKNEAAAAEEALAEASAAEQECEWEVDFLFRVRRGRVEADSIVQRQPGLSAFDLHECCLTHSANILELNEAIVDGGRKSIGLLNSLKVRRALRTVSDAQTLNPPRKKKLVPTFPCLRSALEGQAVQSAVASEDSCYGKGRRFRANQRYPPPAHHSTDATNSSDTRCAPGFLFSTLK